MAAQIPFPYMGPGSQDGKYGMLINMAQNVGSSTSWYSPGYPADANYDQPNAYGAFSTQYPVPEFPKSLSLLTLPLVLTLGLAGFRRNRIKKTG